MPARSAGYKMLDEMPLPQVAQSHMVGLFFRAGPSTPNGMGEAPLSAQELQAWQQGTQVRLAPCEFEMLMRMSRAYLAGKASGEDPNSPAPVIVRSDPKRAAKRIRAVLRG